MVTRIAGILLVGAWLLAGCTRAPGAEEPAPTPTQVETASPEAQPTPLASPQAAPTETPSPPPSTATAAPPATATAAPDETSAPAAGDDLAAALDDYLTRLAPFGFSGAVLLARDGKIALEQGYGWADRDAALPAAAETVFDIGSLTKQFTAAAILRLEMDRKLSVDDPIGAYLEGVPEDKAAITLHQLLTHSAGIASFGEIRVEDDWSSRDESLRRFLEAPLLFEPGAGYEYSNAGYSLLAAIVEEASGQSYEEYVAEQLFAPAGMTRTGYRLPELDQREIAHYPDVPRGLNPLDLETPIERQWPSWESLGNGGILSTVGDLYRWHQALQGDLILDEQARAKLFHPHVAENIPGVESYYGYGWAITPTPRGTREIWHNGGSTMGMSAEFHWYVDEGLLLIILSNGLMDGPVDAAASLVYRRVEPILFGGDYTLPPTVEEAALPGEALGAYEGTYETDTGATFAISRAGDTLVAEARDAAALELLLGAPPFDRDEQRRQRLEEQARAIVAGLLEGDLDAYRDLLPDEVPFEEERAFWRDWASRVQAQFGEFDSAEVVGTLSRGPLLQHVIAVGFERGFAFVVCFRPDEQALHCMADLAYRVRPARALVPESETTFATFSPQFESTVRLRFDDSGQPNSASVIISTPDQEVTARRTGA